MWLKMSVNCQSKRKSGQTVTSLHAITPWQAPRWEPRGLAWWKGGRLGNSRVAAARNVFIFLSTSGGFPVTSRERRIITPALKTVTHATQGFPVETAGRATRVRHSSRGVGARGRLAGRASLGEGVNWALIVRESRIWLDEVRRAGPLILTTPPPHHHHLKKKKIFPPSLLFVFLRVSELSSETAPFETWCPPPRFHHTHYPCRVAS